MDNKNFPQDINECTSRGVCSTPPNIAALYELILYFLEHAAFYIVKLEKLGMCNEQIKNEIISDVSGLVSINEFGEQQLYNIAIRNYYLLVHAKETYINNSENKSYEDNDKLISEFSENIPIHKAISIGEKIILKKSNEMSYSTRSLIDILLVVVKSTARNLAKLSDYCTYGDDDYFALLNALSFINNTKCSDKEIQEEIDKLAKIDNKLNLLICGYLFKNFGKISKTSVSRSTKPGKAILVSGNSFRELEKVLEATKNEEIDIYTHSNLLIAHAFEKFEKYKNLKGHYGNGGTSNILDFATFPGGILLTRNNKNTADYLYRGRIFSNDNITHSGVIKIENNDYSPLIQAANDAKGFSKGKVKDDIIIGYNEENIEREFKKILTKLINNKIKKLYIIGTNPFSEIQKEYFKEFFHRLKSDEYVISFSYKSDNKNILSLNIGNYTPLITNILHKLFENYPINEKIVFLFTVCDTATISQIILLKNLGAKNIYISDCSPTMINPAVFETFKNKYKIKMTSNAIDDLRKINTTKKAR